MWSVLIQWQVKKKVGKSRQVVHKSSGRVINLSLVHPFKPPFEPEGDGCLILHKILGAVSLLGAYKWNCSEHSDGSEEWYFFEVLSIYDVNLSSKMALMLCKKKKNYFIMFHHIWNDGGVISLWNLCPVRFLFVIVDLNMIWQVIPVFVLRLSYLMVM